MRSQLLHTLMILSALVARFFLRSVIPAYVCLLSALMLLYALQWHILTSSTACPCACSCIMFKVLDSVTFPLLLLMRSNLPHALMLLSALTAYLFLRSAIPAYSCFTLYLMPLYALQWHILTRSTICRPAPADALLTAPCSDAFIGSCGSPFPAVGYSCICLLYARSDAIIWLTVAYSDTFHHLPSCSC